MSYAEIMLIVRGYRKRNILSYQFLRLISYHTRQFILKEPDNKNPNELYPLYFDHYKQPEEAPQISEDEIAELQAEMDVINQYYAEQNKQP